MSNPLNSARLKRKTLVYRVGDGFPPSGSKTESFVIKFRGNRGPQQVMRRVLVHAKLTFQSDWENREGMGGETTFKRDYYIFGAHSGRLDNRKRRK